MSMTSFVRSMPSVVWASTYAGITNLSLASIVGTRNGARSLGPISTIFPFSMRTSVASSSGPAHVMTCAFLMRRSCANAGVAARSQRTAKRVESLTRSVPPRISGGGRRIRRRGGRLRAVDDFAVDDHGDEARRRRERIAREDVQIRVPARRDDADLVLEADDRGRPARDRGDRVAGREPAADRALREVEQGRSDVRRALGQTEHDARVLEQLRPAEDAALVGHLASAPLTLLAATAAARATLGELRAVVDRADQHG